MELTGNWYLKRMFFNYIIMVEVKPEHTQDVYYTKATRDDIAKLKINCI